MPSYVEFSKVVRSLRAVLSWVVEAVWNEEARDSEAEPLVGDLVNALMNSPAQSELAWPIVKLD